jgi:hypothetical protein
VIRNYRCILAATGSRGSVVEDAGWRVDYCYDALDRLAREQIIDAVFGIDGLLFSLCANNPGSMMAILPLFPSVVRSNRDGDASHDIRAA